LLREYALVEQSAWLKAFEAEYESLPAECTGANPRVSHSGSSALVKNTARPCCG